MKRDLLDELAELAREEQAPVRGDARFEQLAEGTLDDDELRALEESDSSEEHRATVQASRPLGETARERFLERAKTELADTPSRAERSEAKVLPIRPKRWGGLTAAAAGLLAAAAIVTFLLRPAGDAGLPGYAMTVTGGEQTMRSPGTAERLVLGPGSSARLVLRPDVPVEGRVGAVTFLEAGGRILPIELEAVTSDEGAVRIEVPGREMAAAGRGAEVRLIVVIGRPDELPRTPDALERGRKELRVFEQPIATRP